MRILHCCLACFYIDNYSYQENIIPYYHKKMGHDVMIVASTESFDANGNFTYIDAKEYINEYDIPVKRLNYVKWMPLSIAKKIRKYVGLKEVLNRFKPDFIFLHDVQFCDIKFIKRYAKNNNVTIVADCHADFSNSARNWISKNILHGMIYKHCAKQIEPYTKMFYGVLPARADFLRNVYKINENKIDLLVMGADDELVSKVSSEELKYSIRMKHGIDKSDFLIVTGGKIDKWKKQTLLLMDAVNSCEDQDVKLIVFGSITPELVDEVKRRCTKKVKYIGWMDSKETYPLFRAAELACFPGRHSVFWEQVVGQGIPMLVKYWEGTTHIDCGGNVNFLYEDSVEEIATGIKECKKNYKQMLQVACDAKKDFLYSNIAGKCLL